MTTKYNIGTLNETTLSTLGFANVSTDITIKDCIGTAKQNNNKYIAFSNTGTTTGLDMRGKCYRGNNYNPIINPDNTSGALFDIYGVPDGECTTVENCLKGNAKTILDKELADITALITANQKEKDDVQIRLLAIEKNKDYATAEQEYKNNIQIAELTAKLAELNAKKTLLEKHKMDLSARNSEASILLSDKNRLLATVNSNIQQKYTRLEDVNNQININSTTNAISTDTGSLITQGGVGIQKDLFVGGAIHLADGVGGITSKSSITYNNGVSSIDFNFDR